MAKSIFCTYHFRFGSSTLTSSSARPLTGNFVRTNTDLGFSVPVLKYERFDPPPVNITNEINDDNNFHQSSKNSSANGVNNIETTNTRLTSEFGKPAPLDLDLMSDLEDIINRKTSPLESSLAMKKHEYLSANGPPIRSSNGTESESVSDLILLHNGNSNHSKSAKSNDNAEVIFDPLFEPSLEANDTKVGNPQENILRATGLPRPPSKSSIQQIARNHNLQQQEQIQHQPLTRAFEPNVKNGASFQYNNSPFAQTRNTVRTPDEGHNFHNIVNQNSDIKCNVPQNTRNIYSKSSENLLKEYGLDFTKLSMAEDGKNTHQFTTSSANKPQAQPVVRQSQNDNRVVGGTLDIFADLDPLGKRLEPENFKPVPPPRPSQPPPIQPTQVVRDNTVANQIFDLSTFDLYACDPLENSIANTPQKQTPNSAENFTSSQPPIVPPRSRKSSQNSCRPSQTKWTTFE